MKPLDNVFHELHKNGLLILANVSDAGGAKVVERQRCTWHWPEKVEIEEYWS